MVNRFKAGYVSLLLGNWEIKNSSAKNRCTKNCKQNKVRQDSLPDAFNEALNKHLAKAKNKWSYYTLHWICSTFLDYTLDPWLPAMPAYGKYTLQTVLIHGPIEYFQSGTFSKLIKGEIPLKSFINHQMNQVKKEKIRKHIQKIFHDSLKNAFVGPFLSLIMNYFFVSWKGLLILSIVTGVARNLCSRVLFKFDQPFIKFLSGILLVGVINGFIIGLVKMVLSTYAIPDNLIFYCSKFIQNGLSPMFKPFEERFTF